MRYLLVSTLAATLFVGTVHAEEKAVAAKTKAAPTENQADHEQHLPTHAVCMLIPTKGSHVKGVFKLTAGEDFVQILGTVEGLEPGMHGFHIHEFGDLGSDDGSSAGEHFNPEGHKHGGPDSKEKHVGDLGNINAKADGTANIALKVQGLKLHFVIGRSLVVHAKADDLKSQPSGDSGPRVAVGVIGISKK